MRNCLSTLGVIFVACAAADTAEQFSGIYPHLAYFNNESECGTGAVVPWADRLWVITYAPHSPMGSTDKLYEITSDLEMTIREESVGGTPANRMIHRESRQLNIGPYFIDKDHKVRVIPPKQMPGRLTGTARHLTDPANKLYIATMEEGLYEVDVESLEVKELMKDGNEVAPVGKGIRSEVPGHHGKGLYSSQGYLVYANNGEKSEAAKINPLIPSGALAIWQGSGDWKMIKREQFTEVTGPGGIHGNENPESDPLWAVGWDARSLTLMMLDQGKWHRFRLPKASHSYDGAHGWNTEWPRIRDIGEEDLLMTMHGMFWRFPRTFSVDNTKGITPRSSYLKVVGDFCRWQNRVVLGCDDTAKSEFLNKRKAKGHVAPPHSQSNLWFLEPGQLDQLGPVLGRGAVWLNDPVEADTPSEPFLIAGFARRAIHFVTDKPTKLTLEVDHQGNGNWTTYQQLEVDGYAWKEIDVSLDAVWMRVRSAEDLSKATAWFHLAGEDPRGVGDIPGKFDGVARLGEAGITGGLIHPSYNYNHKLRFAARNAAGKLGYYTFDGSRPLTPIDSDKHYDWLEKHAAVPSLEGVIEEDTASVIYTDDQGNRFRLPANPAWKEPSSPLGDRRLCREVATERDLFNAYGTFYELPANNAGGFARVRPISSHNLAIKDYCSYRGLLVLSGVNLASGKDNRHIIRSDDGKTGLWVGAIDDIWSLGKPVGLGGPWKQTRVAADQPSDPYLMTGYDKKLLTLKSSKTARIAVEIDLSGMGDWQTYRSFELSPSKPLKYNFPETFQAYWIRFRSNVDTRATAQLIYE